MAAGASNRVSDQRDSPSRENSLAISGGGGVKRKFPETPCPESPKMRVRTGQHPWSRAYLHKPLDIASLTAAVAAALNGTGEA